MADEDRFCDRCGATLPSAESRFCNSCGAEIASSSSSGTEQTVQDSVVTSQQTGDGKEKKSTSKVAMGCLVIVISAVALSVTCAVLLVGDSEPSDIEKAEDERKGFHCLSPWDGNHDGLEALIRGQLKDPDSMETIETRITPVDANGNHQVFLRYRARNSFGGMVESQAIGSVDNDTCEASLLSNE